MAHYVRKQQFDAVQFEKEWIILNSESYTVTKLNEVGGFCWSLLSEAQTVATLTEWIQKKYGYEDEMNIEGFLAELVQYGLVQYEG